MHGFALLARAVKTKILPEIDMRLPSMLRRLFLVLAISLVPAICSGDDSRNFYQKNESLRDALVFIGVAPDRQDTYKNIVKGTLPAGAEKALADRMMRVHAEKNIPLFLELAGKPSVDALKKHVGNDDMVNRVIGSIKDGVYLGGRPGVRYFATYGVLSEEEKSRYQGHKAVKFDPPPTAIITFYHFDPTLKRLMGTRFEVNSSANTIRLLLPSFGPGR